MRRYIDADMLMSQVVKKKPEVAKARYTEGFNDAIMRVRSMIHSAATADVVEVRHGTWCHGTENGAVYAKCSACGRKMNYSCYGYAYCALCGARMDGERK